MLLLFSSELLLLVLFCVVFDDCCSLEWIVLLLYCCRWIVDLLKLSWCWFEIFLVLLVLLWSVLIWVCCCECVSVKYCVGNCYCSDLDCYWNCCGILLLCLCWWVVDVSLLCVECYHLMMLLEIQLMLLLLLRLLLLLWSLFHSFFIMKCCLILIGWCWRIIVGVLCLIESISWVILCVVVLLSVVVVEGMMLLGSWSLDSLWFCDVVDYYLLLLLLD